MNGTSRGIGRAGHDKHEEAFVSQVWLESGDVEQDITPEYFLENQS